MAWTSPMTATANTSLSAAQWNSNIRDNLLLQAAPLTSDAGRHFVATGSHGLDDRLTAGAANLDEEERSSTSYGQGGPSVAASGASALVWITATLSNTSADGESFASVSAGGTAASDQWAIQVGGQSANSPVRRGSCHRFTGLSGTTTFTMQYRAQGGTARFSEREIIVMPF